MSFFLMLRHLFLRVLFSWMSKEGISGWGFRDCYWWRGGWVPPNCLPLTVRGHRAAFSFPAKCLVPIHPQMVSNELPLWLQCQFPGWWFSSVVLHKVAALGQVKHVKPSHFPAMNPPPPPHFNWSAQSGLSVGLPCCGSC